MVVSKSEIGQPFRSMHLCHHFSLPYFQSDQSEGQTACCLSLIMSQQKSMSDFFSRKSGAPSRPQGKSYLQCFCNLWSCAQCDATVNTNINNNIRQYEALLITVKKHKLMWYGHVSRSSGLAKNILQGTMRGGKRRGRQKKRWEDNI